MLLVAAFLAAYWSGSLRAEKNSTGALVKIGATEYRVEVVESLTAKAQGLSGRESLAPGNGMLFVFSSPSTQSFWMHGMKFSIDIIWIRAGRVVGVVAEAPVPSGVSTPTFTSPGPVDLVLELPAGTVAADEISVGDKVEIVR